MLTKDNFTIFAAKAYDMTLNVTEEDFEADMKRFLYIKRLLNKYKNGDDLKARLILNHVIILYNCFGEAATPMLFLRMEGLHDILKPFILSLNYLPSKVEYDGKIIHTSDIPLDVAVIAELRKI
jgi:hypothetical protein